MKADRIIMLLLSMLMVLVILSGCGANIADATVSGYGDVPFESAMTKWMNAQEVDADTGSVTYEWQEGWSGAQAPDSPALSKDEQKMTYILTLTLTNNNGVTDELNHMVFYFIHNTKTNTLIVKGGYMDEDGYIYDFDAAEAAEFIENEIYQSVN